MAAYNHLHFTSPCPHCGGDSSISVQLHFAASFDGDASGRFCMRHLRLGERLPRFSPRDPRFQRELQDAGARRLGEGDFEEECLGECKACRGEIVALVRITNFIPVRVDGLRADSAPQTDPNGR